MDSTKPLMSISLFHSEQDSPNLSGINSFQKEYEEWKNDPLAQEEYRLWLKNDEQRRASLPDPLLGANK